MHDINACMQHICAHSHAGASQPYNINLDLLGSPLAIFMIDVCIRIYMVYNFEIV